MHTGGIRTRLQRDRGTRAALTVAGVCGLVMGTPSASQSQRVGLFLVLGPTCHPCSSRSSDVSTMHVFFLFYKCLCFCKGSV